jgi:phage baseplate assembly protein W|tara:strand:- start:576 stop:1019 length:444 start_codon:yes stop_codon:yes gene_type:complete
MVTKAFAVEDGNLQTRSILTARNKLFNDIDLTFANRPSGDLYKKTDAAAVKQAVKNLLLTNQFEKPFQPEFGGNLSGLLFELVDNDTAFEIESIVKNSIARFEPRALVQRVITNLQPDANSIAISVVFQVVNTQEVVTLETTITRLR